MSLTESFNLYDWLSRVWKGRRLPNSAHDIEAANLCIAIQLQINVWEKEASVKR